MSAVVTKLDAAAELRAAQDEHDRVHAHWRQIGDAIDALTRDGVLISLEGQPTTARTLRGGTARKRGRQLDAVEADAMLDELRGRRSEASSALLAARQRLATAKLRLANAQLAALADQHAASAEAVEQERAACERAYVEFVARALRLGEYKYAETMAARKLVGIAVAAASNPREREALAERVELGEVPVALGDGCVPTATRQRPDDGLFGLAGESWNLRSSRFSEELSDIVRGGRRKLPATAEKVENKIRRRLEQLDAEH